MRTTITLDSDVAALIEKERRRGAKLKDLINEALRRGLAEGRRPARARVRPFRTRAVSLGKCRLPSLDDVAEVLAVSEGESFR